MYRRMLIVPLALLACLATVSLSQAAKPKGEAKSASKFIRLTRDAKDDPVSMETAIVRYKANDADKSDLIISLIGAVHIGEKSYYEALNKEFENYEVVLYELVAPEGTRVPKGGGKGSNHPVGMMQDGMKDMLELEHQLQLVDYQKENFVHADMSPEAFSKSMSDRGESIWTMMFRAMGQQLAQQNKKATRGGSELDMFAALFDKNRALSLKRLMAEQFEDLEGAMSAFEGPNGSTIITERNKVALKVLAEQIAAGKKKIAIFYGAGHMPDMEERLTKDLGVHRDAEQWLAAWDLRTKAEIKRAKEEKSAAEKAKQDEATKSDAAKDDKSKKDADDKPNPDR
jgi:hypothetical protein